jgi:hypothetical protein
MYLLYFLLRLHTYIYIHLPYPSVHLLQRLSSLWKFYVKTTYLSFRHLLKRISLSGNICVSIISCQFPHELNLQKGGGSLFEVWMKWSSYFFPIIEWKSLSRSNIREQQFFFRKFGFRDNSIPTIHWRPSIGRRQGEIMFFHTWAGLCKNCYSTSANYYVVLITM